MWNVSRAVPQMPENVAALALLLEADLAGGSAGIHRSNYERLKNMTTKSPEDLLYKGAVDVASKPEEAFRLLTSAIEQQPSLIGHVVRAQARVEYAFTTSDVKLAQEAISDITAAKSILPDNPAALCASVWIHLVAADVFRRKKLSKEREAALIRVRQDGAALARFPSIPRAQVLRARALEIDGRDDEALTAWEAAVRHPESYRNAEHYYAMALYRRGDVQKAVDFLEPRSAKYVSHRILLAGLLTEFPQRHDEALGIIRDVIRTEPSESAWSARMFEAELLLVLGRKAEARRPMEQVGLLADRLPNNLRDYCKAHQDYLANPGPESGKRLLAPKGDSLTEGTGDYFMGIVALADGDRTLASECFARRVVSSDLSFWAFNQHWAKAYLARMKQDPLWPRWIRLKK
jgi:tetratricopeptide (TPR) repeat protein